MSSYDTQWTLFPWRSRDALADSCRSSLCFTLAYYANLVRHLSGASLPAAGLLRMAQDLDKPSDETQKGKGSAGGVAVDEDVSSSDSQGGEDRQSGNGNEAPKGGKGSGKRAAGGEETGKGKVSQSPAASFARVSPPKRPKISLDLDDLDSDSDEEDDEESD